MSRRRRRRISPQCSQPSSPISKPEVQTEQPDLFIRYAETDQDVIAIHKFLLVVARPALLAPVDPYDSLCEIIRVTKEEVAIMAMRGDMLVGTLGLIRPRWWYNTKTAFMTDRWNFCIDAEKHSGCGRLLEEEAEAIARAAGLVFINQGKVRRRKSGNRFLMMPRLSGEASIFTPEGSA